MSSAIELRQNTDGQIIPIGPFLDATNGDSEMTGLTINNTDILLWKFGTTTMTAKSSGGATHMSGGVYQTSLFSTDTNLLGPLLVYVHVATALYVKTECTVLSQEDWDAKYAGGNLSVGLIDGAITAAKYDGSTAYAQTGDAYAAADSRLPAALINGRMDSDTRAMYSNELAASKLMDGADALRVFTVGESPTATSIPTDITNPLYTTPNHYEGRVVSINEETRKIVASSGSPVVLTTVAFEHTIVQGNTGVIS